jgi:hypothetical protein
MGGGAGRSVILLGLEVAGFFLAFRILIVGGLGFRFGGRSRIGHPDDGYRCELMLRGRRVGLCERQQLLFEVFGGDLVQGTGRHLGGGDSHFLRPCENELALEVELLGDVVNADGHTGNREKDGGRSVVVGLQ